MESRLLKRYLRLLVREVRLARVPNQLIEPGEESDEDGPEADMAGRSDEQVAPTTEGRGRGRKNGGLTAQR